MCYFEVQQLHSLGTLDTVVGAVVVVVGSETVAASEEEDKVMQ